LQSWRSIDEELLQQRDRSFRVAGETVEVCSPQVPRPDRGGVVGRERGGQLRELGRSGRRPTGGRLLGGGVQLGCDACVQALGGERQVAGPLLQVAG
jgi:hypothetical protein